MKEKKIGILDPEGKNVNPLTGKKYVDVEYYRFLATNPTEPKGWAINLAVYQRAEEIIKIIRENRVIIAEAGTGTGKTVIIPKLALHSVDYKEQVIVTVPKRALAESSSDYAAKTLGITTKTDTQPDGDIVGFWHSKGKEKSGYAKDTAKLIFATDGSIVPRLNNDPAFENVGIVCVDEVHERNANIDIMLMQLRIALRLNPKLKVILMSATLPKNIFQDYFAEFDPAEVVVPAESTYPVKLIYSNSNVSDRKVQEETLDYFTKHVEKQYQGFTLIFVPSSPQTLATMISEKFPHIKTFGVKSDNATLVENMLKSIHKTGKSYTEHFSLEDNTTYTRLLVVCTNAWESSVTLLDLKIVLDNGYQNSVNTDMFQMAEVTKNTYIAKGQAAQRKGRTGRKNPGTCFRLYTKKTFEEFRDDPIAPVKTDNIIDKIWGFTNAIEDCTLKKLIDYTNQLIEPPEVPVQKIYFRLLYDLGLFESWDENAKISTFGKYVQQTNASNNLYLNVALASSVKYSCSLEMCIMAAMLEEYPSVKDMKKELFIIPASKNIIVEDYVDKIIEKYRHRYGEVFTMFKIANLYFEFATYKNNKTNFENFVDKHRINRFKMDKVIENASIYLNRLPKNVIKEDLELPLDDRLLYSLLTGYFFNIAQKDSEKTFMNFYPKIKTNRISPESKFMAKSEIMKKLNFVFYIQLMKSSYGTKCSHVCSLPAKILNLLPSGQKYFIIERKPIVIKKQGIKRVKKNKRGKK